MQAKDLIAYLLTLDPEQEIFVQEFPHRQAPYVCAWKEKEFFITPNGLISTTYTVRFVGKTLNNNDVITEYPRKVRNA
jgi:hypothetical protein